MRKRVLIGGWVAGLVVCLACQSDPGQTDDGTAPAMMDSGRGASSSEPREAAAIATSSRAVPSVEFAENAFPPLLPGDDSHAGAWMRDDCLLCHEDGTADAPRVRHSGMSRLLLVTRCRSCHLPVSPAAAEDDQLGFAHDAFPPTLPADDAHRGAWMRDDCLSCHGLGTEGAPRVEHRGMASLLLQARCRSCHVPRTDSVELDLVD